ncbi:MAG: preprotein translocase subunit Sec61beta [Candidatus Micrarchaeales archaeon]|nr:preprotein translocase subunit Sec61beta [Candidatus Micrarchaeales archaeon]
MASLRSPQSSAGIINFYDAQTSGPKLNAKVVLIAVIVFAVVVLLANALKPV